MVSKKITLNDIIHNKKRNLEKEKIYKPLKELKRSIKRIKIRANFKKSLIKDDEVSLICEYKPASPSLGLISSTGVEEIVPLFEKHGARASSILTEESYFGSCLDNLKIACSISNLPLLRKDFIFDEYQIYQSRASGASAVLLMSDVFPNLSEGIRLVQYLGMDALVECKNEADIKKAVDAGAEIIGINNRDFNNFSVDLNRTCKLRDKIPPDVTVVSESGVKNAADVEFISQFNIQAILIGTAIMESTNIPQKMNELVKAAKISGE
ncbi:MAG: indole-3-glycerol-phosphate synthase [Methanobacterium sp.]|nr:indole-3-glycerol-phosphate synthase [Methanobacterium sp.]